MVNYYVNDTLRQTQEQEEQKKQNNKETARNIGIDVAASALGSVLGTLIAPGVGTVAGGAIGSTAAEAGTKAAGEVAKQTASEAAKNATGALGAEAMGKVGSTATNIGNSIAQKGSEKGWQGMTNFGTKMAQKGTDLAQKGSDFADWQRNTFGDFGTQAIQKAGQKVGQYGVDYLQNQINENNQYVPPQLQQVNNQFTTSDEKCKDAQPVDVDPVDCFAQIDAYLYKYKPEAQAEYAGTGMVNDQQNFGVMAQELQENPLTQAAVVEDENGSLTVDGSRLSTMNTAVIGELCKRIMNLEAMVYGRQ